MLVLANIAKAKNSETVGGHAQRLVDQCMPAYRGFEGWLVNFDTKEEEADSSLLRLRTTQKKLDVLKAVTDCNRLHVLVKLEPFCIREVGMMLQGSTKATCFSVMQMLGSWT
jgi:hypothetical protein